MNALKIAAAIAAGGLVLTAATAVALVKFEDRQRRLNREHVERIQASKGGQR